MLELFILLILFLFPLAYSPGPGNMFFAAHGALLGMNKIWAALIGYHFATLIMTVIIGYGFDIASKSAPLFMSVIKYLGVLYVGLIAYRLAHAGSLENSHKEKKVEITFIDGVILMVLNPKAYVIIALMFSQFLSGEGVQSEILIWSISIIFTLNNWIAFILWAVIGDQLASAFRENETARKLNIILAFMLFGVAIWMLFI